jgi:FKBP-type peptidyl-prolyl cis-trans isomerase FklB
MYSIWPYPGIVIHIYFTYICSNFIRMKQIILIVLAVFTLAACNDKKAKKGKVKLSNQNDSFSYAFGANTGRILKNYNVKEINWEVFKACVEQVMKNGDSNLLIDKELEREVAMNYLTECKYGEAKKKGEEFIAKMKKEGGYTVTPSGLLFKSVAKGTGVKPLMTDTVFVHYTGRFIDGKVFDSSIERKDPLKTAMNSGAVKGFLEALSMMDVGSKAEVIIPYDLAYGKQGMQNPYSGEMMMEPYQTLIFDLELVSIKK